MENNEKNADNNKNDNNDKGISALELDRDLGFSRGHQGHQGNWPHADENKKMITRWRTTTRMTTKTTTLMTIVSQSDGANLIQKEKYLRNIKK